MVPDADIFFMREKLNSCELNSCELNSCELNSCELNSFELIQSVIFTMMTDSYPLLSDFDIKIPPVNGKRIITSQLSKEEDHVVHNLHTVNLALFYDYLTAHPPVVNNDGQCSFNPFCVKRYLLELQRVNEILATEVERLIKQTRYVSHSEFVTVLNRTFDIFEQRIGTQPFTLVYSNSMINSEQLCTFLLWTRLKRLNLIKIQPSDQPITTDLALWIDDCSYSGGNMSSVVDEFVQNNEVSKQIYLVVAFATPFVLYDGFFGSHWPAESHIIYGELIPRYCETNGGIISQYFWTDDTKSPIYFDHKIASPESTFNYIYFGLIPTRPLTLDECDECCPINAQQRIAILKKQPNRHLMNQMTAILVGMPIIKVVDPNELTVASR